MESHSLENSKVNFQYQNLELKIANKVIACDLQKTIQGTMKFTKFNSGYRNKRTKITSKNIL